MHRYRTNRRRFLASTASTAIAAAMGGASILLSSPASAAIKSWTLEAKRKGNKYQYNGKSTGPIIAASAGETIEVKLINSMEPKEDDVCVDNHNSFHGENVTNLHTHGLHVSPTVDSTGAFDADNVFLKVVPLDQEFDCWDDATYRNGKTDYRFELPADHPPGTHWYHAHKHGSTARQVVGGLAGPLIVKDPPGWMPDYIANAPERIFMITTNRVIEVDPNGGGQDGHTIKLAPGAVERWRIINANPGATSFFNVDVTSDDVELWQIAFDGITLKKRILLEGSDEEEPWNSPGILAPGNRMDVMVRVREAAAEGPLALTAERPAPKFLHAHDGDGLLLAGLSAEVSIEVAGTPDPQPWSSSDDLPGPMLADIPAEPDDFRTAHFDLVPGNPRRFEIEGKIFGEDEPLYELPIDTIDQWILTNGIDGMHPFHIHVNPFFVTHINGELPENSPLRRWQDVVAVPPGGFVKFLTHYKDFKGRFVIHCHILRHEDRGMMRVVEVI